MAFIHLELFLIEHGSAFVIHNKTFISFVETEREMKYYVRTEKEMIFAKTIAAASWYLTNGNCILMSGPVL